MTYSEKLIRGIASKDFIDPEGRASAALFQFGKDIREDGFAEASITWYDDETSLDCVMNQRKPDGSIQFKIGVAIISRSWIDMLIRQPTGKDNLKYERAPLTENPAHGNLLRNDSAINGQIKSVISASIAMGVERVITQT